jgi:hypothetical protein
MDSMTGPDWETNAFAITLGSYNIDSQWLFAIIEVSSPQLKF